MISRDNEVFLAYTYDILVAMNKIWRGSTLFTLLITALTYGYIYAFYGKMGDYQLLQVFGVASVLVIAPSLALSGITYFWPRTRKLIIYRKSLGLLGFYLGLVHVGLSMWDSGIMLSAFTFESIRDTSIVAGYGGVLFFALMPLVSNRPAILLLGGTWVRKCLRYFGYAAYILVLFHAYILSRSGWERWQNDSDASLLIPPTLVAVGVATLVLGVRAALFLATYKKRTQTR